MPDLNSRPENTREVLEAVEPESILPPEYKRSGEKDILSALFESRERIYFTGDRVPAWWTPARDEWLWRVMMNSDVMSSAIFSTSARLQSIPIHVVPYDPDNRNDRRIARWSDMLLSYFWNDVAFRLALDWQTQDNGTFVEIMGAGEPGGPIEPTRVPGTNDWIYATGLRVLDSQKAVRTKDPTYPVIYLHKGRDGVEKWIKFHETRIAYVSQMPTTRRDMLGVGFCGVSRCIRNVLRLDDYAAVEEEMVGARPISQMIFSRGVSAEDMEGAFTKADERMALSDTESRKRTARTVFVSVQGAADTLRAASIESFDLKKLPEGYNPEVTMNLAMNILAMSLGFDPREFWPATVRGATRADAEVQHWKAMRKTPGLWVGTWARELGNKFAPNIGYVLFDQQDDEQDAARAAIRYQRAQTVALRLESGQWDHETAWQEMLADGDITESQLEQLRRSEEIRLRMDLLRLEAQQARSAIRLTENQADVAEHDAAEPYAAPRPAAAP